MGQGDRRCLVRFGRRWGVRKRLPPHYKGREHKKICGSLEEARRYRDWLEQRILYRQPIHEEVSSEPRLSEILETIARGWPKRDARRSYLHFWTVWAGELRPSQVNRIMVQEIIDSLTLEKAAGTVKLMVSILSAAFAWAVENDALPPAKNPFRKKLRMPTPNKRRRAFSLAEARAIMARLGQYAPMMEFTLLTGFRTSEMLSLTWEFVDLAGRYIQLPHTKGQKEHVLPISTRLLVILEAQKALGSLYVFPQEFDGAYRAWPYAAFRNFWRPIFDELDLKECVWHTGRHSAATWAVHRGVPLYTVKGLLNHSSLSQSERYSHHADSDQVEAQDAIAAYLHGE